MVNGRQVKMQSRASIRGFTLMEVGLAMAVSFVILGAVVAFYRQVRDDAGDAGMRQRINSLASVVEGLYSAQGTYPTGAALWQVWRYKRPDDYLKSPYGGDVWYDTTQPAWINDGVTAKYIDAGTQEQFSVDTSMSPGGLYYYYVTSAMGTVKVSDGTAQLFDITSKAEVTIRGYGVAGLKTKYRHFMVTSGR